MKEADIAGLIEQFKTMRELAKTYIKVRPLLGDLQDELRELCERYNDAVSQFDVLKGDSTTILKSVYTCKKGDLFQIEMPRTFQKDDLLRIILECEKALGVLQKMVSPVLTQNDIDKLNHIRRELEKISSKINVYFEKNILESIKEYEEGHHLASVLISSRVIRYSLDKVPGEHDDEKVEYLKKEKKIEKSRKDLEQQLIKASRLARNFLSHDIKIFATPEEALSLLSDSFKIVKLVSDL